MHKKQLITVIVSVAILSITHSYSMDNENTSPRVPSLGKLPPPSNNATSNAPSITRETSMPSKEEDPLDATIRRLKKVVDEHGSPSEQKKERTVELMKKVYAPRNNTPGNPLERVRKSELDPTSVN